MGDNRVYDPEAIRQIVLFEGLPKVGPCSMSDVDGRIAVRKMRRMMVVETGHTRKVFGFGQRAAMEDDVKAYEAMGWIAIAVLTVHETPVEQPIRLDKTVVKEVYWRSRWRGPWAGYEKFESLFRRFWRLEAA